MDSKNTNKNMNKSTQDKTTNSMNKTGRGNNESTAERSEAAKKGWETRREHEKGK